MAYSRVLRAQIIASRSLSRVSLLAELFFWRLILVVDEWGRSEADPVLLRSQSFPRRPEITAEQVAGCLHELDTDGCLRLYVVDGIEYLWLPKFETYRSTGLRRGKASRFPDPPQVLSESPRTSADSPPSVKVPVKVSGSGRVRSARAAAHPDLESAEGKLAAESSSAEAEPSQSAPAESDPAAAAGKQPQDPSRLLNLIARFDGSPGEKRLWMADELPVIEVEADGDPKKLRTLFVRFYRRYLQGERPWRKEASLEGARRKARALEEEIAREERERREQFGDTEGSDALPEGFVIDRIG